MVYVRVNLEDPVWVSRAIVKGKPGTGRHPGREIRWDKRKEEEVAASDWGVLPWCAGTKGGWANM